MHEVREALHLWLRDKLRDRGNPVCRGEGNGQPGRPTEGGCRCSRCQRRPALVQQPRSPGGSLLSSDRATLKVVTDQAVQRVNASGA
jgi:hypothetical protein